RRASECGKQPINEHRALVAQPRSPVRTIKSSTSDPSSGGAVRATPKRPHEQPGAPPTAVHQDRAIMSGPWQSSCSSRPFATNGGGRGLNGGTGAIDLRLRLGSDRKKSKKTTCPRKVKNLTSHPA